MITKPLTIIEQAIKDHFYDGNGKCWYGAAIGHSDGVAWETFKEEHQAVEILRSLDRMGYVVVTQ